MPKARALRALPLALAVLLSSSVLGSAPATARAQEPTRGFGFDLNLDGGFGFAFQNTLQSALLGRLRLGGLYVTEPWVFALGVTGELGGLARHGVGVAAEVSSYGGFWARLASSRVADDDWMLSATVGFLFFGLEYQRRLDPDAYVNDAAMLVFRTPFGLWWFLTRAEERHRASLPPRVSPLRSPSPPPQGAPVEVDPADRLLASRLAEEARLAEQQEHWAEAEVLLERALRLDPSPLVRLRLSRAQRHTQHLVASADNLRRFIDAAVTPEELAVRPEAEQERLQVLALLPHLRLRVEPLPDDMSVWLDGKPFNVAALGYPLPIDPGDHVIEVRRAQHVIVRQPLHVEVAGNATLKLDPTAPTEPAATTAAAPTDEPSQAQEDGAVQVGAGAGQAAD